MFDDLAITVNGHSLSEGQKLALMAALSSFYAEIKDGGLKDAGQITDDYAARVLEILKMISPEIDEVI